MGDYLAQVAGPLARLQRARLAAPPGVAAELITQNATRAADAIAIAMSDPVVALPASERAFLVEAERLWGKAGDTDDRPLAGPAPVPRRRDRHPGDHRRARRRARRARAAAAVERRLPRRDPRRLRAARRDRGPRSAGAARRSRGPAARSSATSPTRCAATSTTAGSRSSPRHAPRPASPPCCSRASRSIAAGSCGSATPCAPTCSRRRRCATGARSRCPRPRAAARSPGAAADRPGRGGAGARSRDPRQRARRAAAQPRRPRAAARRSRARAGRPARRAGAAHARRAGRAASVRRADEGGAVSGLLRPSFSEGQILGAADLNAHVTYDRLGAALHERTEHLWGVASGLELVAIQRVTASGERYVDRPAPARPRRRPPRPRHRADRAARHRAGAVHRSDRHAQRGHAVPRLCPGHRAAARRRGPPRRVRDRAAGADRGGPAALVRSARLGDLDPRAGGRARRRRPRRADPVRQGPDRLGPLESRPSAGSPGVEASADGRAVRHVGVVAGEIIAPGGRLGLRTRPGGARFALTLAGGRRRQLRAPVRQAGRHRPRSCRRSASTSAATSRTAARFAAARRAGARRVRRRVRRRAAALARRRRRGAGERGQGAAPRAARARARAAAPDRVRDRRPGAGAAGRGAVPARRGSARPLPGPLVPAGQPRQLRGSTGRVHLRARRVRGGERHVVCSLCHLVPPDRRRRRAVQPRAAGAVRSGRGDRAPRLVSSARACRSRCRRAARASRSRSPRASSPAIA